MIKFISQYLKHKFAADELLELYILKRRINDLTYWTENKYIELAAKWLEDPKNYPCQYKGGHGSIVDFREYIKKLEKEDEK